MASPATLLRSVPGWLELTVAYVGVAVGYIIYASFLSALLEKEAGFSAAHTSAVFSVMGLVSIIGSVATGRLADRIGWGITFATSGMAMAGCALLVLGRSEPWVALSTIIFGLFLTATGTFVVGYLSDHLHGSAVAAAFGAVTLPFGVAQAVGPWLGGWVRDATGTFSATFVLSAAAFALVAVSASLLPRDNRAMTRA